ncbi:MAG: hypothetical protein MI861_02235 [Pirellulales bacterium]|nr:hypothetical protein [Pirellulales bacterium]
MFRFSGVKFLIAVTFAAMLSCVFTSPGKAQESDGPAKLAGTRSGNRWVVPIAESGKTRIPRVCASLRAAYFEGFPDKPVIVHPEIEHWEVRFKGEPSSSRVVLEFDSFPVTLEEAKRTEQAGDGTLTLSCSQGRTWGEKLRFEPQPHKNTIGYWTVASDSVSWPVTIARPGPFNVGLLQGAGTQGGGTARVSLIANEKVVDSFEFKVEPTGHFQNFVWKHAGTLTATTPGNYSVKVEAIKIDKVALMDVRQVHLSPKR